MTRRARPALAERAALSLALGCALSLLAPPDTRASTSPNSTLVPWPVAGTPSEGALSGGLAVLRAKGSRAIRIPASTFVMGSTTEQIVDSTALCEREPLAPICDERSFADELTQHVVHLSGFFLDRTEVTVADYEACVRLRRCKALPYERGAERFKQPRFPATFVSWQDARAFCTFRGARLPTEAEFERAARGSLGRRFPWGQLANGHLANHGRLGMDATDDSDGFAELAPVGSFSAGRTPDGFLDLAGNVSEWVQDRYAPQYPDEEVTDPTGPDATLAAGARVIRGGSYESPLAWLRGAARGPALPAERRPTLGFRCARSERGVAP